MTADQGSANAQRQPDMAMLDPPTVDLTPFTSTCIYKPPQGYRRGVARGLLQQIRSSPRYSYCPSIRSIVRSVIARPAQAAVVNNIPAPPNHNPSNFTESMYFPSPRLVPTIHNSVIHPPTLLDGHDREVERAAECTAYEPKVITQNAPLVIDSDLRTVRSYITLPDVHDRKGKRAIEDILYECRRITRNAPLAISSGSTPGNFKAIDKSDKCCEILKGFAPLMKSYPDGESMRHLLVTEHSGGYKEANLLLPNVVGGPTMAETNIGAGEEEEAKAKGLDLSLHL